MWLWEMIRYNLKVIFAGKFIWFLSASIAFFILVMMINLFSGVSVSTSTIYKLILFPGLLLIFYPTVFGIQNDEDNRIIEILFGIPDYRYKVWMFRLLLIFLVVFLILLALAVFCSWALYPFTPVYMAYQLIYPVFFMGALAFFISTIVRNGIGTAVVMVLVGVFFLILGDIVRNSQWNIFLNPFKMPDDISETAWKSVIHDNRIILLVGIILTFLGGLMNLQRREKFI
ncbi:MAG: hypothetical protein J7L89_05015 [Bacteroidales bacterium]|nr:hypothetical protein [Bacteroidales bacterium]